MSELNALNEIHLLNSLSEITGFANDCTPEPVSREIPPPKPYPVKLLGEDLGALVQELHEIIQAPDGICAQSILATVATVFQGLSEVVVDGREYPLSSFFISVADSGERKSAVDTIATVPIHKWQKEAEKTYQHALTKYWIQSEAHKGIMKDLASKGKKSKEDDEKDNTWGCENIEASDILVPQPPATPILLIEEPTYQGLVKMLVTNIPVCSISSDEGGRMIGGHAFNKDNSLMTMSGLSELWNGKPITRVRAGEPMFRLDGIRFSLHLMFQPIVAERLLGDEVAVNQGFLARCLICWPSPKSGERTYQRINLLESKRVQWFHSKIEGALKILAPPDKVVPRILKIKKVQLSEQALTAWIDFHNEIETKLGKDGAFAAIKAFASKAPEHAIRIAGLLNTFENPESLLIEREVIMRAIELVRYYLEEYLRVFAYAGEHRLVKNAKSLLTWIHNFGYERICAVEVYQKGPNFLRDKHNAQKTLEFLTGHGWLKYLGPAEIDGIKRNDVWEVVRKLPLA